MFLITQTGAENPSILTGFLAVFNSFIILHFILSFHRFINHNMITQFVQWVFHPASELGTDRIDFFVAGPDRIEKQQSGRRTGPDRIGPDFRLKR